MNNATLVNNNREMLDKAQYEGEQRFIEYEYSKAYFRTLFCPQWELEEANEQLKIWRHKYFST
jgi:hypothetical protein